MTSQRTQEDYDTIVDGSYCKELINYLSVSKDVSTYVPVELKYWIAGVSRTVASVTHRAGLV